MMHPVNKFQRRRTFKSNEEKKQEAAERSGRVWRKLSKENYKEQETENDLREFLQDVRTADE